MTGSVRIIQLDRAFAWNCWLCPAHLARRKATGFQIKVNKPAPEGVELTCDDCHFGEPTTISTTQGASDAD